MRMCERLKKKRQGFFFIHATLIKCVLQKSLMLGDQLRVVCGFRLGV